MKRRFFILAVLGSTFSVAALLARAEAPPCDRSTLGPAQVLTVPGVENARDIELQCGPLLARARVRDRGIALAVYRDHHLVFDLDDSLAFGLYGPLVASAVADGPGVALWTLTVQGYETFGTRLAAAAALDPRWDSRLRKPKNGGVDAYVIGLANRDQVFDEVRRLAADHGFRARVTSAEKVLLCPVPGKRRREVPCGASVWFELSR